MNPLLMAREGLPPGRSDEATSPDTARDWQVLQKELPCQAKADHAWGTATWPTAAESGETWR